MNIYKIVKCSGGAFYKIFRAVRNCAGIIYDWDYVGMCQHLFQAEHYVRNNGRKYNPKYDNAPARFCV